MGLHELRTVLSGARAGVEALSRRAEGTAPLVEHVRGEIRRAEEVLDALLALEAADRPLEDAAVPLEDVVAAAVERFRCDLASTDRIEVGRLPVVRGDRAALVALFAILVENAVKYRMVDDRLRVRVAAYPSGPDWLVEIEDNGRGVHGDHDRILQMYEDGATADRAPGAGIGLAACRRIVGAHGGRLWLEPAPGRGTLVAFTLPALPTAGASEPRRALLTR